MPKDGNKYSYGKKRVPVTFLDGLRIALLDGRNRLGELTKNMGVKGVPGLEESVLANIDNLLDSLGEFMSVLCGSEKRPINKKTSKKEFIAIYKQRFLTHLDSEYDEAIDSRQKIFIQNCINTLSKNYVSSVDYIDWFFERWLPFKKGVFRPKIGLACHSGVVKDYLVGNREIIRKNKEKVIMEDLRRKIIDKASKLYNNTKDKKVRNWIAEHTNGLITIEELQNKLVSFEKELKERAEKGDSSAK